MLRFFIILSFLFTASAFAQNNNQAYQIGLKAYQNGNYKSAFETWYPLAENGDLYAQYSIGLLYDKGEGITQDVSEAARWFQKSAAQGHVGSQAKLAAKYATGEGVTQDDVEAAKWLQLAAVQGDGLSQASLATKYALGKGVKRDFVRSWAWFHLAAEQNVSNAEEGRSMVADILTPEQLEEAKRLAQEWHNQYE